MVPRSFPFLQFRGRKNFSFKHADDASCRACVVSLRWWEFRNAFHSLSSLFDLLTRHRVPAISPVKRWCNQSQKLIKLIIPWAYSQTHSGQVCSPMTTWFSLVDVSTCTDTPISVPREFGRSLGTKIGIWKILFSTKFMIDSQHKSRGNTDPKFSTLLSVDRASLHTWLHHLNWYTL